MPLPYQITNPFIVASDALTAPPSNSVAEETAYLIAATASSIWTDCEDLIAIWRQGRWETLAPEAGMIVYSVANGNLKVYSGSAWVAVGGGSGTVTEVAVTGAGGVDVSGSPITTDGTIALDLVNVPNASLANSSVTVAGTTVALGASGAVAVAGLSDAPAAPSANNFLSYATGAPGAYVATTGMTYNAGTTTLYVKSLTIGSSSSVDGGANRLTNIAVGTASGDALQKGQLAGVSGTEGANLVGLQDSAGKTSETTVEGAIAELYGKVISQTWDHFISWHGNTVGDSGTGTLGGKNASVSSSTDYDASVVMYNFTSSTKRGMAWNWCVPSDLDTGEIVSTKIYFKASGAVDRTANSTVYWGIDCRAVADNESAASGGSASSITGTLDLSAGSHASGDLVVMDMGTLFAASTLAAGDYVKGVVWRDALNASDNYESTCQHIGIRFIGTKAKQF